MGSLLTMLNAGNEHRVAQAQVEANRQQQDIHNRREATRSALQMQSQSIQNKYVMEGAQNAFNQAGDQILELMDSVTQGNIRQRLTASMQLGAARSAAAAAGVGGASVEAFERTQRLLLAFDEGAQTDALDIAQRRNTFNQYEAMQQGLLNQDTSLHFGNLDYTIYLDHQKQKFSPFQLIPIVGATLLGGPQAGTQMADAQMQMSRANYLNSNGRFQEANEQLSSAFDRGMNAFKSIGAYRGANDGRTYAQSFFQKPSQTTQQGVTLYGLRLK
ncbi:internal virion protein [Aquamicrobium phage P14]|uniref:Putative internal virion protein n=1 Tax=Aquamicrobium phage P14 TaxID=1927013 RepID=A0A1L5C076_9CAUD|nr:internal virion protein [Aquamicrobium phage P14]APL99498.1 putative internal virion protein [Aquamicrobium phage P14]